MNLLGKYRYAQCSLCSILLTLDPVPPGLHFRSGSGTPSPHRCVTGFQTASCLLHTLWAPSYKRLSIVNEVTRLGRSLVLLALILVPFVPVWLTHQHYSHFLGTSVNSTCSSVCNSCHCESGARAKADSITQTNQYFEQNYDLPVIHESINCLFFPALGEVLATIESLTIINGQTR